LEYKVNPKVMNDVSSSCCVNILLVMHNKEEKDV